MTNTTVVESEPEVSTDADYRDDLRVILDNLHTTTGLTRYRLCKEMGIDSGTLSNVLAKRRHFSLEKLEKIMGMIGYRMKLEPNTDPNAPTKLSKLTAFVKR